MTDKEKQIEEMGKILCNDMGCKYCERCYYLMKAENLYNAGYRKITNDLVVLNRDEYNNLIKPTLKSIEAAIAKFAEQEAKKKIVKLAKAYNIDVEAYE